MHYTLEGRHAVSAADPDGSGVPDFVEQFGRTFDQVYQALVQDRGFRPPLDDSVYHDRPDFGGDGRFDVYLQDQSASDGYFVAEGCNTSVPQQCAGYLVVENDFRYYGYPTPQDGMKILASHEFFHAIQNAYRAELPRDFSESTAVWATEQVFPEEKDFETLIPSFFKSPGRSLNDEPSSPADPWPYALAVWPAFLSEKHGAKVIPAVLEELSEKGHSASDVDAIDVVLKRDHQSSLPEAFATFALWNYFTGDRAGTAPGYQAAATFPTLAVAEVTTPLPFRMSGEIACLSATYSRLAVTQGTRVKVTVEYAQPELALHLITGEVKEPKVVSNMPDQTSLSIDVTGEVILVAASTARKDHHLPLSLAITEEAVSPPPVPPNPPDPPGPSPQEPTAGEGGCSVVSAPPAGLTLLLGVWVAALTLVRQRRRRTAAVFGLVLALLGCSESTVTPPDSGVDTKVDTRPAVPEAAVDHRLQPDGPSVLPLGQFAELVADGDGVISGSTPTTGAEEYLLLLLSLNETPLKAYKYTTTEGSTQGMVDPRSEGASPGDGRRCTFQDRLRQILDSRPQALFSPKRWQAASEPPKLGEQRTFSISDGVEDKMITGEVIAVDSVAAYWLDKTTTPLASVSSTTLAELADGFGKIVVPRERVYFGKESDIDGDGTISVLFSPLVSSTATAYFSPCDVLDPAQVPICKASNRMELLYMTPPSSLQPPMNTAKAILETVAHELQHAIYFNHKYLMQNRIGGIENPYITEGLSALAQDLSGYQGGNFFVTMAGLEGVNTISVPNSTSEAVKDYVGGNDDGIMRGAGYLLLRYLFDRAGGDDLDAAGTPKDKGGIAWLHAFEDSKEINTANFTQSTGLTLSDLIVDFWSAMALSNRGPNGEPINPEARYNYLPTTVDPLTARQRGCNLFGSFHGVQMTGPHTQSFTTPDGSLRAGGAEFLLLGAKPGQFALVFSVKTDPAAQARLRVIRVK
jgi:hypothetical protein